MLRLTPALALLILTLPPPALADITGKPRVVDGDTIHIGETKIRLHGIDAPETRQECTGQDSESYHCGKTATDALRTLFDSQPVRCEGATYDRYKRLIAVCYSGTVNLNAELVRLSGSRFVFVRGTSTPSRINALEASASAFLSGYRSLLEVTIALFTHIFGRSKRW